MSHFTFIGGFLSLLAFFWSAEPKSYMYEYFKLAHKQAKQEYGLEVGGAGTGCKERKIDFFSLKYLCHKFGDVPLARKLIIGLLDDDLKILEKFNPIHKEMLKLPITHDALDIGIRFYDIKQQSVVPGQVIYALKVNNKIIYYTRGDESPWDLKEIYEETVEEARAKLQEEALKHDPKGS